MASLGDFSLADKLFAQLDADAQQNLDSPKMEKESYRKQKTSVNPHEGGLDPDLINKGNNGRFLTGNFTNPFQVLRGRRGHLRNQSLPRNLPSQDGNGFYQNGGKRKLPPCTYSNNTSYIDPRHFEGYLHVRNNAELGINENSSVRNPRGRSMSRRRGAARGRGNSCFNTHFDTYSDSSSMRRSMSSQSLNSNAEGRHGRRPLIMGFKRLQELTQQEPKDIVTTLINDHFGFSELLNSHLRPDILILVIKLLSRASDCEFEANKCALLSKVCQSPSFLDSIKTHLSTMPMDDDKRRNSAAGEFLSDLLKFYETVMKKLPNTASERFKNIFISTDMALDGVKRHRNIEMKVQREIFDKLFKQLNNMIEEREQKTIKTNSRNECLKYELPPDDFRDKSLFPTLEDLFGEKTPFIRPNIIEGAFNGVEDYLDIQFRLLREDFVAPLRDGLAEYLKISDTKRKIRINNVRFYRNVTFGDPKIVNDSVGVTVSFDREKKMKIRWEYSKRFMFGSLLIFTKDNFKNVIFGTVLDREVKQLQQGEITVMMQTTEDCHNSYGSNFVMVESEVYFEPYKHVMKALQSLDEFTFPMKKYIVSVHNDPSPPRYLLVAPDYTYEINKYKIQVLNKFSWPDKTALQLDSSQLAAFKAALTEEFVVIQGPPGTGKTYLGLKITKVLLRNQEIWNIRRTPILIVCYTNHALDQFLEGLVSETEDIVRVGGQSKSDKLFKFNLRVKRRGYHFKNANSHLKREYHSQMASVMKAMKTMQSNLEELKSNRGIVSPSEFKKLNILTPQHGACFEDLQEEAVMREWLWEGSEALNENETHSEPHQSVQRGQPLQDDNQEDEMLFLEEEPKTQDFDYELFDIGDVVSDLSFALDITDLEAVRHKVGHTICQEEQKPLSVHSVENLQRLHRYLDYQIRYWKTCLATNHCATLQDVHRLEYVQNIWALSPQERWILYKDWVNKLKISIRKAAQRLEGRYRDLAMRHDEIKQMCDFEIMQNSLIVGMTTTNAARQQSLLQALKPKIVIVEEAAEVLESHIVVSLTNKCEHVILIGDHQQLRPAPAVYRLAREFHLDVSLFERMVKNGMTCYCLENQHRMRPEISSLIKPTIYPNLKNDISVYGYPAVRGITKSLFFISHNVPEEEVEDISSRRNRHEGDFLLALCRHLVWQGYSPKDITILVTYKGQMFYMKLRQKKHYELLDGVKITVVDNYQGEENKIILLSLVRSNEENNIGFLKTENRVCVALSRAKEGFYIIGNMDCLVSSSSIWPKVKESLEKQMALGPHLTLQCQIHHDQHTTVACAADFQKVPEGGCLLPCAAILTCGHQCKSICHANNREHKDYKCHEPCQRIPPECSFEHPCPKQCFEDCGSCNVVVPRSLTCGHEKQLPCHIDHKIYKCLEKVDIYLPDCSHNVQKPCHKDIGTFPCPEPCPDRLPCGHSCTKSCHANQDPDHLEFKCRKRCTRKNACCTQDHECTKMCYEECGICLFEVDKELPDCNHIHKVKCSEDLSRVQCKRKCERKMECGHPCPKQCFDKCGGCQEKVLKVIPTCGHKYHGKCNIDPDPTKCKKPCKRRLACGHPCNLRCGQPCSKKCLIRVQSQIKPLCGHTINIPCYMQNSSDPHPEDVLSFCQMPCGKLLQCGHQCRGCCGECMQGRLHSACGEKCDRSLICGHKCQTPCAAMCPPCNARCLYRCEHSRCNSKCGVPCTPCKEPCGWGCFHQHCSKLCHEPCDIEPCQEPCPKKLKCGHPCIGFCGDYCPPLCKICNKEEVTEIFFGREEEDDARFVYLVDCKHTLEAEGLENWLQASDNEITLKTCPRCKSYIQRTKRYMNYMKKTYQDVSRVKNKVYGEMDRLEGERIRLLKLFQKQDPGNILYIKKHSKMYDELCDLCVSDLLPTVNTRKGKRQNYLSSADLQSINSQIEIFNDLVSTLFICITKAKVILKDDVRIKVFKQFDLLLGKLKKRHKRLRKQETSDFNCECKRFFGLVQLAVVESSPNFPNSVSNNADFKNLYNEASSIIQSIKVYSLNDDARLKAIIKSLSKTVGNGVLTERERREIVQAVGVKQGAWYKCPNGHIYCIGECGGAVVTSKCPDCKAEIGGGNHRLLASNSLASEMDGATQSAWPGGLH